MGSVIISNTEKMESHILSVYLQEKPNNETMRCDTFAPRLCRLMEGSKKKREKKRGREEKSVLRGFKESEAERLLSCSSWPVERWLRHV